MRTLLLADDNITVQRVIALTFAGEEIQVVTAADGQQAIEKMAARQPDIVLAGTTLPNVNGYDLARFMRNKTELQMVPVLLLAGAFDIVDEARLAASGANGIIEKPVEPTTLINRVKELLGLKSEDKPAPTGRLVTPGSAPAERTRPSAMPPRSVTPLRPAPSTPLPNVQAREDHPRDKSGLDAESRPMADSTKKSNYLDSLDAAFDSLDQQLSGLPPTAKTPRNPAGPLGQGTGAADPRSPGRAPSTTSSGAGKPVFEVDDDWFAGDDKARPRRTLEQEPIANGMGVYDAEPSAAAGPPQPPIAIRPVPPASTAPIDPVPLQPEIKLVAPEITDEMLDQIASRVADRLTAGAFGEALKDRIAATMRETVHTVVTETSERLIRDSAPGIVAQTSERIVRDTVHGVVTEASERMVRDTVHAVVTDASERMVRDAAHTVVTEASERMVRDTVHTVVTDASERMVRDTVHTVVNEASERMVRATVPAAVTEASERMVRDTVHAVVTEASERMVHDTVHALVAEASERMVRDIVRTVVAETSERAVRETLPAVVTETSERLIREAVPSVVAATSDRIVRDTVHTIVVEASQRALRDTVPAAVAEASERLVREMMPAVIAETSDRLARDTMPGVIAETSERLVREAVLGVVVEASERLIGERVPRR